MKKHNVTKHNDVTSGLWKFHHTVTHEQLAELAKTWADEDTEGKYLDLHVRKCSKDQYGIGFQFLLNGETYKAFFNRMTDLLKRSFGNDFVGRDVSPFTYIIK